MTNFPFGFSSGDDDDKNRRDGDGNPGDPHNPLGGQGFDPNQLGQMLSQLGQMLSGMGGAMNDPTQSSGPVNYTVAAQIARQQIGQHTPVSDGERSAVNDATHLAEMWLDAATTLDHRASKVQSWTSVEWLEKTIPTWERLCNPVAEKMATMWIDNLPEEQRAMAAPMMGMMTQMGGMAFGSQIGQALGQLAKEVLTGTDIGIPLAPEGTAVLLPEAINKFVEGLEQSKQDVVMFLAAREAAHQRLFASVPWLRTQVLAAVEEYARGIHMDMSAFEQAAHNIDPTVLQDPSRLEELFSQQDLTSALEPKNTPEQKLALERLETLLALIEGWVGSVVHHALANRLPAEGALAETMRRRRATGGPAEQTFATLVGLELRPRKSREAAQLWERVLEASSVERRDAIWEHPDLLPDPSDLDNPAAFIDRIIGGDTLDADLDDPIAALERTLKAEQEQQSTGKKDEDTKSDSSGPDSCGPDSTGSDDPPDEVK